jgi:GNAT superfamily N-acetyltransferase
MRATIRATDDEDAVAELDRECFTADEARPIDFSRSPEMWLATLDGKPVGYAVASLDSPDAVHFDRYGVVESARGAGLGRRLVNAAIRWARLQGAFYVHTYTHPSNAASINVLMSCGFRAWQPMPSEYDREDTDAVRSDMEKWCFWRRDLA